MALGQEDVSSAGVGVEWLRLVMFTLTRTRRPPSCSDDKGSNFQHCVERDKRYSPPFSYFSHSVRRRDHRSIRRNRRRAVRRPRQHPLGASPFRLPARRVRLGAAQKRRRARVV